MSLVSELQSATLDESRAVSNILRYAKVLAARTKSDTLGIWVERELNGYAEADELPPYRVIPLGDVWANFAGPFRSTINNVKIPSHFIPVDQREKVYVLKAREPIAEYEALVQSGEQTLRSRLGADFVAAHLAEDSMIIEMHSCVEAWRPISAASIRGLIDAVRTKLLDLTLELEREVPSVVTSDDALTTVDPAILGRAVTVNVTGGTNTIVGSTAQFTQVISNVHVGDWSSLEIALREIGMDDPDVAQLRAAMSADDAGGEPFGERVRAFLKRVPHLALKGSQGLGGEVAASVVGALILKYLGIG